MFTYFFTHSEEDYQHGNYEHYFYLNYFTILFFSKEKIFYDKHFTSFFFFFYINHFLLVYFCSLFSSFLISDNVLYHTLTFILSDNIRNNEN